MPSALDELMRVLPPLTHPVDNRGEWSFVENQLGTAFPDDYKEFIATYGAGAISCELWIFNPFRNNPASNLLAQNEELRDYVEHNPIDQPYGGSPLFPAPSGLIQWGKSNDGDMMFWITSGQPNQWGTSLENRGLIKSFHYPQLSFTSFLLQLVQRQIKEYQILLIDPPYSRQDLPYEFCTPDEVKKHDDLSST